MDIHNELRNALRRKQAPGDLAVRVLDRARGSSQPLAAATGDVAPAATTGRRFPRNGATGWLATAAVLTLAIGGARYYVARQEAAETERVREELQVALRITNETVARVQSKISRPSTTDDGERTP
jgi:hypothetical protein